MSRSPTETVEHTLDRLRSLAMAELQQEWQRAYRTTPPRLSRDLLLLGLGYRVQEQRLGRLAPSSLRALRTIGQSDRACGSAMPGPSLRLTPGARLVREWQGRTHVVTVIADGYEHDGAVHKSLSTIAKAITGSHWSGPRFFGLSKPSQTTPVDASRDG